MKPAAPSSDPLLTAALKHASGQALGIGLAYVLVAVVWILASDEMVGLITHDPARISQLQTWKGSAFVGVTGVLLVFLIRRALTRVATIAARQRQDEAKYIALFQSNPLPMWVYDLESLRFVAVNGAAIEHYGWSRDEFLSATIKQLYPPEEVPALRARLAQRGDRPRPTVLQVRHQKKDGSVIDVELTSHPLQFDDRPSQLVLAHDITARLDSERKLERLRRLYAALSETNQAVVRIENRQALFDAVCRIAVKFGGFRLAWIGLQTQDGSKVVVAAHEGADVQRVRQHMSAESAYPLKRQGPIRTVVETGQHLIVNDILAPPAELIEAHACFDALSAGILPLREAGTVIGTLNLFAAEADYFDQGLIELLDEMVINISFALDNFIREASRREAEAEVRRLNTELELRVSQRTGELETANTRLTSALKQAEDLYENAPCGYHSLDDQGRIVQINETELRWLGYRREELIGRPVVELYAEKSHALFAERFAQLKLACHVDDVEYEVVRKDGSRFYASASAVAVCDEAGTLLMVRSTLFDVTARRQVEAELAKLNQRLADRAADLEAANRELEAFSYSVSHDLRAPLRAMDGFSRILDEEYSERLNAEGRGMLRRISAAADRMAGLIDDLLQLSRLTRQEMHVREVDVSAEAAEIIADLQRATPQRQVDCRVAPGLTAQADPGLLHAALFNLLENAWKYTRTVPRAEIEVGRGDCNDHNAFFIRDNGIGFDPQYADRLFTPFQRLHSDPRFEGSGIGLATVKRVILRHGGRVWARSQPGQGASFYFTLPPIRQ